MACFLIGLFEIAVKTFIELIRSSTVTIAIRKAIYLGYLYQVLAI
jgi:hypothetical protein